MFCISLGIFHTACERLNEWLVVCEPIIKTNTIDARIVNVIHVLELDELRYNTYIPYMYRSYSIS